MVATPDSILNSFTSSWQHLLLDNIYKYSINKTKQNNNHMDYEKNSTLLVAIKTDERGRSSFPMGDVLCPAPFPDAVHKNYCLYDSIYDSLFRSALCLSCYVFLSVLLI